MLLERSRVEVTSGNRLRGVTIASIVREAALCLH